MESIRKGRNLVIDIISQRSATGTITHRNNGVST
jgi:hypothetical protein